MIFLENFSKILLFLHLVSAFALVGCMTHDLVLVVQYCRGQFRNKALERLYVQIAFWCYLVVFALGGLIYPTFRIRVRAAYFDSVLPWATGLFEVKEHLAAIGLGLMLALFFLRMDFDPEAEREKLILYVPLCFLIYLLIWYNIVVGYYLVTLRAV